MATIEVIFFIDVITALIAILTLLFFLQIPAHSKAILNQTTSYFSDLKKRNYIYTDTFTGYPNLLIGTGILLFVLGFFLIGNKVLVEAGKSVSNEPNN